VFTPTLFVGLAMGCCSPASAACGGIALQRQLCWVWLEWRRFWRQQGMPPIMSTLMICEMTGQYALLPGLLKASVLASVLSRTLRQDSIYRHHLA
jgi:CIC family chloride channel protein